MENMTFYPPHLCTLKPTQNTKGTTPLAGLETQAMSNTLLNIGGIAKGKLLKIVRRKFESSFDVFKDQALIKNKKISPFK